MSKNQEWTKKVLGQGWMRHNFKGLKKQGRLPSGETFYLTSIFQKRRKKIPQTSRTDC
jgi:hypothetical protein